MPNIAFYGENYRLKLNYDYYSLSAILFPRTENKLWCNDPAVDLSNGSTLQGADFCARGCSGKVEICVIVLGWMENLNRILTDFSLCSDRNHSYVLKKKVHLERFLQCFMRN